MALPETVAIGEPGFGYVEHWSVTHWIEGRTPEVPWDDVELGPSRAMAEDLARFVSQIRAIPVPAAALDNPALSWYPGGPLAALDADFREAVDACRAIAGLDRDLRRAARVWEAAVAAEQGREPTPTWYHGDLLAENLLMRDAGWPPSWTSAALPSVTRPWTSSSHGRYSIVKGAKHSATSPASKRPLMGEIKGQGASDRDDHLHLLLAHPARSMLSTPLDGLKRCSSNGGRSAGGPPARTQSHDRQSRRPVASHELSSRDLPGDRRGKGEDRAGELPRRTPRG